MVTSLLFSGLKSKPGHAWHHSQGKQGVRFEWLDFADTETNYFEFRIVIHELTNDTALMITDHADEDEIEDAKDLWDTQISYLKKVLGLTE